MCHLMQLLSCSHVCQLNDASGKSDPKDTDDHDATGSSGKKDNNGDDGNNDFLGKQAP